MIKMPSRFATLGYMLMIVSMISLGFSGRVIGAVEPSVPSAPSALMQASVIEGTGMLQMMQTMPDNCEPCPGMMNQSTAHCNSQSADLPQPMISVPSLAAGQRQLPLVHIPLALAFSPEPPPPRG